ncbi:helix-turn-helix transcriptional regulator [Paenibacillus athensensis]|uniref:HTH arsR-type domain-containing protein n=1 Tax=Paenibacillus athensensis TaxID=1967502 RepID=A0A4Y8Q5W4_9BACL|nr:metalloregulator ArsR/SmtB family transcription factor [Paenibacillus athensensis]MCD1258368.1 helix-turn-helix transcriptional regulator [Paenibacillus athensensis]
MNDHKSFQTCVKIYKALGEPTRLRIVQLLGRHGELSCMELLERLQLSAGSTVSHHLRLLLDCDLLALRKEGTYHYYSLQEQMLRQYAPAIAPDHGETEPTGG